MRFGTAFDAIEARIEEFADLDDDQRAALWLYAWSRQGRRWQRRAATQYLQSVASGV